METDTSQTVEPTAETPETGEEPQGPDYGPLMERFDQLGSQFEQQLNDRLSPLEQAFQQIQEPEQGQEPENPFQDPDFDPYDPAQMQRAQQQLEQQITQKVESQLFGKMQELVQPLQHEALMRGYDDLMSEYPALATNEGAEPVMQAAHEFVEDMGLPAETAKHPAVLRLMYEAQVGRERAEQETPAGAQTDGVQLEQGGATPAEPEEDNVFLRLRDQGTPGRLDWD
jgi:hypothetical protein